MEKRIKLAKNPVEIMKKQGFGSNQIDSRISASKEQLANKPAKENEMNTKRTLSSIQIQEKPLKKFKNKDLARRSRARLKGNDDEVHPVSESAHNDDDQNLDESLMIIDKKTKKLKTTKSQADEAEAHLELTDEETQTSKAEENNNPNRIPNVMDQFGLGQSFSEQSMQQQNLLRRMLNSNFSLNDNKSNLNFVEKKPISESTSNFATTENDQRQGHYTYGDRPLRIVKTAYNENINDMIFTMDWKQNQHNNIRPAASQITREELLKFDPLLLVYYYEKHLEFTQYPDQPDFDLEKIPH